MISEAELIEIEQRLARYFELADFCAAIARERARTRADGPATDLYQLAPRIREDFERLYSFVRRPKTFTAGAES